MALLTQLYELFSLQVSFLPNILNLNRKENIVIISFPLVQLIKMGYSKYISHFYSYILRGFFNLLLG